MVHKVCVPHTLGLAFCCFSFLELWTFIAEAQQSLKKPPEGSCQATTRKCGAPTGFLFRLASHWGKSHLLDPPPFWGPPQVEKKNCGLVERGSVLLLADFFLKKTPKKCQKWAFLSWLLEDQKNPILSSPQKTPLPALSAASLYNLPPMIHHIRTAPPTPV